jgi:uncharacterized protein
MLQLRTTAHALLVACGLAFALAAPASAQDTPALSAAQVAPDRLAAARDLLQATNTDSQFATVIPMMFGQLKQSMPSASPKMQQELDQVFEEVQKQFIERRNEVLDQIAILYAQKFTAEEMKSLADFYRSPIGQKFIVAVPELTAEAMKMGNAWGRRIAMDAERKVREEMKKRGFDL